MILASKSPRRKELLEQLGYNFKIISDDVEEVFDSNKPIGEAIEQVAQSKGANIAQRNPNEVVISADTIIYFDNKVIGKPQDYQEAFNTLQSLSGCTHQVISGVAVFYQGKINTFHEVTNITFKELSSQDIDHYLAIEDYHDKAGSYAIQSYGANLIASMDGNYNNVVGLPIERLNVVIENMLK